MKACPINRTTISNGIQEDIKETMVNSNLFTEQDGIFTPIDEQSDYQGVVDKINSSYEEQIVMPFNSDLAFAITEPSDRLVGKYLPNHTSADRTVSVSNTFANFIFPYKDLGYTILGEDKNNLISISKKGNPQIILESPKKERLYIRVSNSLYKEIQSNKNIDLLDKPVYSVRLDNGSNMFVIGMEGVLKIEMPEGQINNILSTPNPLAIIRKDNKIITQYPNGVFKVEVDKDAVEQYKKEAQKTYEENEKEIPKIIQAFKDGKEKEYYNNENPFFSLVLEAGRKGDYFAYNKELQSFVHEEINGDEQFSNGEEVWNPKKYDRVINKNDFEIGQIKTTEASIVKQLKDSNKSILKDTLGYVNLWASQEGIDRYQGDIQHGYDINEYGHPNEKYLLPEGLVAPKLGYTLRKVSGGSLNDIRGSAGAITGYTYYHGRSSDGNPDAHVFIDRVDKTGVYIRYTTVKEDFRGKGIANLLLNRVRRDYPDLPIHRTLVTNPIIIKQSAKIAGATDIDGNPLPKFKDDKEIYDWLETHDHIILPPLNQNISSVNYWDEPGFKERNPNFNHNAYINSVNKFGENFDNLPDHLNPSYNEDNELTPKQDTEFRKLQKSRLISTDSTTVNGITYYKIPEVQGQRNEEAKDRLEQIIQDKNLDFIHVIYAAENYLIQLGTVAKDDQIPQTYDSITRSSRASSITKSRVLHFLDNIGFRNIQTVSQLVYKGEKLPHNAYIDFLNGVMQIREGQEDYTFPEEAMTILVKLIQQSRPELYDKMYKEVINYQLYRDVVNDPAYNNKLYQKEDGSKDYEKIREEAITKLLTEFLINGLEGTKESQLRIHNASSIWQQILNWIKEVFGKYKNPFKEALAELNVDDTTFGKFVDISSDDIFLSAKSVEQIDKENPDNKGIWQAIRNKPSEENIIKVDEQYYKDGVLISGIQRVSYLKDKYYKELFGDRNIDEDTRKYRDQAATEGSYIHEVFEEEVNSWIDPTTGLMKRTQTKIGYPLPGNPLNSAMVKSIQNYVKSMMASYPQGTRFISEQIVYDPNAVNDDKSKGRYGTIDFLAVEPDGKVDILDWKSTLIQDETGVKDYKKEGYFIQLNEYRRMLKDSYGVTSFGKLRAIPVSKTYKVIDKVRTLQSINIGNADAAEIPSDQRILRPIISPQESTGSTDKDKIVTKLESLYQKYVDKGYFKKDRNILNDVQEAIYEIRVAQSIDSLTSYLVDLQTRFRKFINEANDLKTSNKEDISEALAMIKFYQDIVENVVRPAQNLIEEPSISVESRAELQRIAGQLNYISDNKLADIRAELMDELAKKDAIFNLLSPEKVANLGRRWFRSMGSQDIATVRYMYELVKKSYNRIDFAQDEELKKLKEHNYNFEEWRKKAGLSAKDAIAKLVNYEKGRLHSKISVDFYEKRREVLEEKNEGKIIQFVKENYDIDEYVAWYNKTLQENQVIWNASTYSIDEEKNKAIKRGKLLQFEKNYNIFNHPISAFGYHNTRIWSKNLKEDKWYSDEYKELIKTENKALLDMYDFFVEKNKQLAETGAIEEWEAYTFLPNVLKKFSDIATFSDKNALAKVRDLTIKWYRDWRNSLTVDSYQLRYQGATDPFTGEKLNKRFIPYVNKLDNEYNLKLEAAIKFEIIKNKEDSKDLDKRINEWRDRSPQNDKLFSEEIYKGRDISFDLFTIYGLMTKEIHKEKYLSENDEILRALVHIEKMKPSYKENKWGTVAIDPSTGKPVVGTKLGRNVNILEEHMKSIVEGEHLQTDSDFVFKVAFRLREKWNKTWLGKLYQFDVSPETYEATNVSATKFIMWMNNVNQKRILGINLGSAMSNLFGGTFSSTKLYEKYASIEDLKRSWLKLTSGGFYKTEEMKKNAALMDYFLPLLNNREAFKSSQLSVSGAAKVLSQEWIMSPMRKTSEIVQANIFLAIIENSGVVDGKIVNLREKASLDSGYLTRYNDGVSPEQRKQIEKDFKQKVKEYKEKYSLVKYAQFKTIKEAGKDKVILELPGIDRNSSDVEHLRELTQTMAKDSLGEADEFDMANYKYSLWWRLFMTFKNWIPRMADVRFGEFRYSQAHHSYEYGRFRMFAKSWSGNFVQNIFKLIPAPYLTGKLTNAAFGKEALIERAKQIYAEKKEQEELFGRYNKETFISQGEFVDRYIKGTEATFAEVRTLIFMGALLFTGLAAPDDDDTPEDKAFKTLARTQINKLIDEVGFFYSPKSGIDLFNSAAPVFSFVRDSWNLFSDLNNQFFGFTLEKLGWDEKGIKMQEKAKPVKRIFKIFPVMKEILKYLPAIDNETAKEWGVTITDRRNF